MDTSKISKSTTGRALKLLLDLGKINYIIKEENKRKCYFYLSLDGSTLDKWLDSLKKQQHFFEKILQVRDNSNEELNKLIQYQASIFK